MKGRTKRYFTIKKLAPKIIGKYIKSEKTTGHATFSKEPSVETMEAIKKMMDLAYDMPRY